MKFKLSLRALLLWLAVAPLMLATAAGMFGPELQLVFCFDTALVVVLLLYSGLAEQWLVARHRAKGTDVARIV